MLNGAQNDLFFLSQSSVANSAFVPWLWKKLKKLLSSTTSVIVRVWFVPEMISHSTLDKNATTLTTRRVHCLRRLRCRRVISLSVTFFSGESHLITVPSVRVKTLDSSSSIGRSRWYVLDNTLLEKNSLGANTKSSRKLPCSMGSSQTKTISSKFA